MTLSIHTISDFSGNEKQGVPTSTYTHTFTYTPKTDPKLEAFLQKPIEIMHCYYRRGNKSYYRNADGKQKAVITYATETERVSVESVEKSDNPMLFIHKKPKL